MADNSDMQAVGGLVGLLMVIGFVTMVTVTSCNKKEERLARAKSDPPPAPSNFKLILATRVALLSRLKDPDSAKITDVHVGHLDGKPVVCGMVNSRNSYGGMTGPQRFIGVGDTVFTDEDGSAAVAETWAMAC